MFDLDLDDVKSYLGYTDASRDVQVSVLMEGAFAALKEVMGRNLEFAVYRDTFQFRGTRHYVREYPLADLLEIRLGDTLVPETEYKVFKTTGYVHFPGFHGMGQDRHWLTDGQFLTIDYVGGYRTLPGDIKLALLNAIQGADNIQKQNAQFGGPVKRLAVYDVGVTDIAVPRDGVYSIIQRSLRETLEAYVAHAASLTTWMVHESERLDLDVGSPT